MSKILIIEDEVAIADLEKDYLELSGFDVAIENRGDKGLQTALKEEFDLIILDLMLPGMDGFEVCRKIRENSNVPILMVSAKKDDIDKIRGLGLGADDYITKPFSPSELVARVKAHMARYERLVGAGQKTNDIIEIRNLKIDKTGRIPITCSARRSFSPRSGIWRASAISPRSLSISRRSGRRSSTTRPSLSILRQSGAWDTASRFKG